jgi:hypothetical protein
MNYVFLRSSMSRAARLTLAALCHERAVLCGLRHGRGYLPTLRPKSLPSRSDMQATQFSLAEGWGASKALASCSLFSTVSEVTSERERALGLAHAATLLDEANLNYQITFASAYMHLGHHALALEQLLRVLSLANEPEVRSRLFANCAAAAERLGDSAQAHRFSGLAISEWRVSSLAVYNHQRLGLSSSREVRTPGIPA